MLHVIIIKTTQFLLRKHLFFSFASAAYLQRKSLYLSLFDCQNLFTANKLIPLQRTRPGDRGINDAAKSTCSETTRHRIDERIIVSCIKELRSYIDGTLTVNSFTLDDAMELLQYLSIL